MNRLKFTALLFLSCFFLFSSCGKKENRTHVSNGFYFWKSKFQISEGDQKMLRSLQANKMYVKFFDADWEEGAERPRPYATSQPQRVLDPAIKIVPTVFITNRAMEKLAYPFMIDELASNIYKKTTQLAHCFDSEVKIDEIQIDCDWNESTREYLF